MHTGHGVWYGPKDIKDTWIVSIGELESLPTFIRFSVDLVARTFSLLVGCLVIYRESL